MILKSIILFYRKEDMYTIIGRNYPEDEARVELDSLREQGMPAFSIDQDGKHFDSDSDVEKAVKKVIKNTALKLGKKAVTK